jgi:glycine cleavage system H lipoate-binding protein
VEEDSMVALLVAVTILALVAADYFLLKPRRAETEEDIPLPGLEPLSAAITRLPAGVFLQPTFTWSRIRPDGDVLLGVHPLLFGLVGAPYDIERLPGGERVEKGAPLVRIRKGARSLTVRSPVAGRIAEVNRVIAGETEWNGHKGDGGSWLYRVVPEHVASEVPGWLIAESAAEWTRRQYERMREMLQSLAAGPELAATMADGGEIPAGILTRLDDATWTAFEQTVLGS